MAKNEAKNEPLNLVLTEGHWRRGVCAYTLGSDYSHVFRVVPIPPQGIPPYVSQLQITKRK